MRTGRSLTVCQSLLPGGVYLVSGGVLSPGGHLVPGVSAPGCVCLGGVCSGGCLLQGVVCSGGCLLWGVSGSRGCLLQGGVCSGGGIPGCTEADTPPVNRMIDRCKNITLATTSLRPEISLESIKKDIVLVMFFPLTRSRTFFFTNAENMFHRTSNTGSWL